MLTFSIFLEANSQQVLNPEKCIQWSSKRTVSFTRAKRCLIYEKCGLSPPPLCPSKSVKRMRCKIYRCEKYSPFSNRQSSFSTSSSQTRQPTTATTDSPTIQPMSDETSLPTSPKEKTQVNKTENNIIKDTSRIIGKTMSNEGCNLWSSELHNLLIGSWSFSGCLTLILSTVSILHRRNRLRLMRLNLIVRNFQNLPRNDDAAGGGGGGLGGIQDPATAAFVRRLMEEVRPFDNLGILERLRNMLNRRRTGPNYNVGMADLVNGDGINIRLPNQNCLENQNFLENETFQFDTTTIYPQAQLVRDQTDNETVHDSSSTEINSRVSNHRRTNECTTESRKTVTLTPRVETNSKESLEKIMNEFMSLSLAEDEFLNKKMDERRQSENFNSFTNRPDLKHRSASVTSTPLCSVKKHNNAPQSDISAINIPEREETKKNATSKMKPQLRRPRRSNRQNPYYKDDSDADIDDDVFPASRYKTLL